MRMLDVLPDEPTARRFGDYLVAQGIDNQVEEQARGWTVWVVDDDHLPRAGQELAAFRADPAAERFGPAAAAKAEQVRAEREEKQAAGRRRQVDVRTAWAGAQMGGAPLTIALIAVSLLVGLLTKFGSDRDDPASVQTLLYFSPPGAEADRLGLGPILSGQVWRVFTPIFLHFGPLHLLFNMLWLADLGTRIERARGTLWLAVFVLLTGALSNLLEHFFSLGLTVPGFVAFGIHGYAGGMSGVVYGLFGFAWIRGRVAPYEQLGVPDQTRFIMLAWLFLCMTGLIGAVANVAHVAGLLCGMAAAYLPVVLRRRG